MLWSSSPTHNDDQSLSLHVKYKKSIFLKKSAACQCLRSVFFHLIFLLLLKRWDDQVATNEQLDEESVNVDVRQCCVPLGVLLRQRVCRIADL